jgi:hypothetical protein
LFNKNVGILLKKDFNSRSNEMNCIEVLVFAITGIMEDARRARADKEAVRDELEDASNRVSDLRTRLQRSELTAAALLDSLQRLQDTSPVARKHPRYK